MFCVLEPSNAFGHRCASNIMINYSLNWIQYYNYDDVVCKGGLFMKGSVPWHQIMYRISCPDSPPDVAIQGFLDGKGTQTQIFFCLLYTFILFTIFFLMRSKTTVTFELNMSIIHYPWDSLGRESALAPFNGPRSTLHRSNSDSSFTRWRRRWERGKLLWIGGISNIRVGWHIGGTEERGRLVINSRTSWSRWRRRSK